MKFLCSLPVVPSSTDEGTLLNSDVENYVQGMFSLKGETAVKTLVKTVFSAGAFTAYINPLSATDGLFRLQSR